MEKLPDPAVLVEKEECLEPHHAEGEDVAEDKDVINDDVGEDNSTNDKVYCVHLNLKLSSLNSFLFYQKFSYVVQQSGDHYIVGGEYEAQHVDGVDHAHHVDEWGHVEYVKMYIATNSEKCIYL